MGGVTTKTKGGFLRKWGDGGVVGGLKLGSQTKPADFLDPGSIGDLKKKCNLKEISCEGHTGGNLDVSQETLVF